MLESHTVKGQNCKLFLASCALAPGFDQRDFTARRLGELLSGNREWACPGWRDISDLLYCVRACFPVKKTPRKSYPAMTLLFLLAQLQRNKFVRKKVPQLWPQHLTFDFTLDLEAIFRTLDYAIYLHLLFSTAFGRSTFFNLHLNNVCNTDCLLDIKCPPCICTDSAQSGQWWWLLGCLWLDCWWSWYPPRWWWLWG